jgi:hypothetical protein
MLPVDSVIKICEGSITLAIEFDLVNTQTEYEINKPQCNVICNVNLAFNLFKKSILGEE